ncbi:MAG: DUF4321 domain-containing protein [Ruminococcus sp.]|jgi:hypothetical protein|nr:DUF4321 domain-containing protein [Ruminococcus sp.]
MRFRNAVVLLILLLTAFVGGDALAKLLGGVDGLHWLTYGGTIGFPKPFVVDLNAFWMTFGFTISLNLCQIILLLIAVLSYKRILGLLTTAS